MYKLITHSITEQHYDHPMTAEVGMGAHAGHTGNNAHHHGSSLTSNVKPKTMTITYKEPKQGEKITMLPPSGVPVIPKDGNVKVKLVANVKVKKEGNIKADIKAKTSDLYDDYNEGYDWNWGQYDAWGDLSVHGDLQVTGDVGVTGLINGTATSVYVTVLESDPNNSTWTGNIGEVCVGPRYMYACTGTDTWVRWPIQANW